MAFLGKTYVLVKHENLDSFLKEVAGFPEEQIQKYLQYKLTNKIVQNGDSYTVATETPNGIKETTFKSGVEHDDTIRERQVKSCYVVDGNTVTQTIKHEKGSANFKRIYNGDELVVEITSSGWDGIAKIFFKA